MEQQTAEVATSAIDLLPILSLVLTSIIIPLVAVVK
jgi:hypothetical protein